MIYLDNAATTFPKPLTVRNASAFMLHHGANPGRSGHEPSMRASEEIFHAREAAAELFHAPSPVSVIFTLNCTSAINMVMKGILKSGDHVIVSELEHNAVMRPLNALKDKGITYSVAKVYPEDNDSTVNAFRRAINANTRMIFCTQASNVWGIRLPVERLCALAHEYGLLMAVDAAQSAGIVPIDLSDSKFDFLCIPGHKGLYGPMGTGMLIVSSDTVPKPLIEGGTGSNSQSFEQPEDLPDRLESGTPNVSGIAGLRAGIGFVSKRKPQMIAKHEYQLMQRLYSGLKDSKKVCLYFSEPKEPYYLPLLSFNIKDMDSETAARELNRSGIAVRAGLQCSPMAHRMAGTEEIGAVRASPSVFSTASDIDRLLSAVNRISRAK